MDNRSHEETDWDFDLLAPELQELRALDFDLELTGFDGREVDELLADPELEDRANAVPELPKHPVTKPGNVWLCGKHRVLCGDATATDAVSRACGLTKPLLMVTDAPYGVQYDPMWREEAGLGNNGRPAKSPTMIRSTGPQLTNFLPETWHTSGTLAFMLERLRRV